MVLASQMPPSPSTEGRISANLDARVAAATVPFDVTNAASYAGGTPISVYDSLGREHALSMYFQKTGDNTYVDPHTGDEFEETNETLTLTKEAK